MTPKHTRYYLWFKAQGSRLKAIAYSLQPTAYSQVLRNRVVR